MNHVSITAVIVFHREESLAIASLASFHQTVLDARGAGLTVESIIACDRPNDVTLDVVRDHASDDDAIRVYDYGDLSLTRNAAIASARGEYVACFDGDDLWGSDWLRSAHTTACSAGGMDIYHPEFLFYFSEDDFDCHSTSEVASFRSRSVFFQQPTVAGGTVFPELLIENIWSANCFCRRDLYSKHPYRAFRRDHGFGIEDWSWNLETLVAGVSHRAVDKTVHLIRIKNAGSLGSMNGKQGLLPFMSSDARKMFYAKTHRSQRRG